MKRILGLVFSRWTLMAIGLLALALVIWWVGPTISIRNFYPLESEWVRWVHIVFVVLLPVARLVWKAVRARRNNATLVEAILGPAPETPPSTAPDPAAQEVAQLRQRFEEALALLRKLRFGTDRPSLWTRMRSLGSQPYLYDLPWYVFIGAPGAGKTTALLNSGLRFPLAPRLGEDPVRGVGGTRHCDWLFADEAVFLDTAGRFMTHESDRALDAASWQGFLQLLKKSRPRRPVNGVLVTVSAEDLLQRPPAEVEVHAQTVRARVRELYQELGLRLPVYFLVTKIDLLAGFTEFFAALGKDDRGQVCGVSLPHWDRPFDSQALGAELVALERSLHDRLPERLEEERDAGRRALLYGFPQQFALLRSRLVPFVDATFGATKVDAAPMLRGIYFTSGTQEGSPIDRVMGTLARDLGLGRRLLPAQHPTGRSYFLTRLLREVVFPEAGLAGVDVRWEQRRQWLHRAGLAGSAVALVAFTAGWWVSYVHNREYLGEVATQFEDVKKQVTAVQAGARTDVSALLATLGSVRTLSETRATPDGSVPWSWRLGLYQGTKIETASRAAYRRMLQDTFLPSVAAYVERYLATTSPSSQDDTYDALRTYLMLYDAKRFRRDAVWTWLQARGEQLVPGGGPEALKAMRTHFDALYDRGWVDPALPRNDALVARARAVVGRDSLPNRIYARVKREPTPDVRDFTIVEKAGPNALRVLERTSRQPLTKGVPGLYTKDGYYKHVVGRVDVAAAQLAEEDAWVQGTGTGSVSALASTPQVVDAVKRLYLDDYRRIWREFVSDITVVRGQDLTRTIDITLVLSAPDTPLKPLMKAIDYETTLSVPPDGGVAGAVRGKAQDLASKAGKVFSGVAPVSLEKTLVDDHFEDVRRFLASPGGNAPAPIDTTVQQLNDLYRVLVATQKALDDRQPPPPADTTNRALADAPRLPEPIRSMLQDLIKSVKQQVDDKGRERVVADLRQTRAQIEAELRAQVTDFCTRAIADRYPFVRTSAQDVPPDDFARLFAPGGLLETFFQKNLAAIVDTTQKPWRFKDPAMGASSALPEFQRAQVIRDVFFRGGGSTMSLQLDFKPMEMDATIQQFLLDVDGKLVRYAHGPQVPVRVQFPGPGGRSQVRVSISPPPSSGSAGMTFEGPWALFRMFDDVQLEPTSQSERFIATISIAGRRAVFEMLASSVRNPFRLTELTQFRCPRAL